MAKWGEGDARWIVDDRPDDGRNVNGWHWEEKNVVPFVRQAIEARVCGKAAAMGAHEGWARITGLKELKGEASLSTRKGNRKVAVYDLTVTLSWEGFDAASETSAKGELKVAEFASANDEDELVFTATVEGKGAHHEALRKRAAQLRKEVIATLLAIASEITAQ